MKKVESSFFALLEKLSQIDEGFTYRIAYNQENKCTGFVIMTAGMRSNIERFSSFLCLDAMKRPQMSICGPTLVLLLWMI